MWVYGGASGVPFYVRQNRNHLSPPSAPVQRRLQGPPAKSNFLAVSHLHRRLQTHHHRLQPEENTRLYEQKLKKAGCFVMITNIAKDKLSAREVLKTYKQQYGVEKNFSFLKEPLIANDTFLKKPSRIDALTFILLVSLMIWNLMQRDLRKSEQVRAGLKELGLERSALADLPKNAPAKGLLAHIITEQTSVPQKWIAQTLHMGSAPYVSKLAKEMKLAMPRSKKWRDVKQRIIRFIT